MSLYWAELERGYLQLTLDGKKGSLSMDNVSHSYKQCPLSKKIELIINFVVCLECLLACLLTAYIDMSATARCATRAITTPFAQILLS